MVPWYYHTLDGPTFTNKTVDGGVQVRNYDALLWASTDVLGTSISAANSIGFGRLFDYISGANEASMTIDMTTPVLDRIQPGLGPNCNSTFTISFFVPFKYQNDVGPPAPTSDLVYIQTIADLNVAVTEYDGYAFTPEITAQAAQLQTAVDDSSDVREDVSVEGVFYFAGYDSPYHTKNRHNEDFVPIIEI